MPVAHGELGGWRSRTTFVLALVVAAVGLGTLWRFAWLMGSHGSAAFMLTYIASLFLVAVPVCCAEAVLGIVGRGSPVHAIRVAAESAGASPHWMWLGLLAAVTGVVLAACQSVVGSWSLAYLNLVRGEVFAAASVQEVAGRFGDLIEDTAMQLRWLTVFVALLGGVLALGVRRGLGMLAWLSVPLMLACLALLVGFAFSVGDLDAARDFLFTTRLMDFDSGAVLDALVHALLSLGTGVGAVLVFGAYAPARIPLGRSVMAVALFNTLLALLAGVAIMPLLLASNLLPVGGPGMLFIGAPYAYGNLGHSEFYGVLFFGLMAIAGLGSAVAMLEPLVAVLQQHLRLTRPAAATAAALAVWVLGWIVAASMSEFGWNGYHNLLDHFDFLAVGVLLPLMALVMVLLVGWVLRPEVLRPSLGPESALSFSLWRALLRYITPPALALVLAARFLQ